MKILVTGAGSLIGQGIIRSLFLSKIKFNLYTSDYFNNVVGRYWSKKFFILPDFLKKNISEKKFIDEILFILKKHKIDLLIPGIDFELPLFIKYKKIIESNTNTRILINNDHVIKIGNDKWETYKFLKNNNFFYPKSFLPSDLKILKKIKFPLIIKPRFGNTSKDVYLIKDEVSLNKALKKVNKPIIQEYISGENKEYTCSSSYVDNKILSIICLKRTLKNGNTISASHEKNKNLDEYIKKITLQLQPQGVTNFQLRLSKKGPIIFEINPRFSGTTPIRALFGVNEVEATINKMFYNKNTVFKKKYGLIMRYTTDYFVPLAKSKLK